MDGSGIVRRPYLHREGGRVLTKQSEASESDINSIVARYVAHGTLPVRTGTPLYGDFSAGLDYRAALERVRGAQEDFAALPAAVRDRCENDLGTFVDLVGTASGLKELLELGLDPERVPAPSAEESVPPVEPDPEPA